MTPDKLINQSQFCEMLGCKRTYFVTKWKKHKDFPPQTGVYTNKDTWRLSDAVAFFNKIVNGESAKT